MGQGFNTCYSILKCPWTRCSSGLRNRCMTRSGNGSHVKAFLVPLGRKALYNVLRIVLQKNSTKEDFSLFLPNKIPADCLQMSLGPLFGELFKTSQQSDCFSTGKLERKKTVSTLLRLLFLCPVVSNPYRFFISAQFHPMHRLQTLWPVSNGNFLPQSL